MNQYSYDGSVMAFGRCVSEHWTGTTVATSEKKAKSNLAYQWKKENGYTPSAKIILPDRVTITG